MINKEIVVMQVRHGKHRDLPDAGEKGQLLFSSDVGRVFIGLPSKTDPASLVANRTWESEPESGKENVEILTEFTPWNILNKVVHRPYKYHVPAKGTAKFKIKGNTRLFVEYVAYDNDEKSSRLESGSAQVVTVGEKTILSQFNNTNAEDGIVMMEIAGMEYDADTRTYMVEVSNSNKETDMTIEFILRGWDDQAIKS